MSGHIAPPIGCVDTSNHAHDYRLTKPDGYPLPVHAPSNDHSEQRATAARMALAYNSHDELLSAVRAAQKMFIRFNKEMADDPEAGKVFAQLTGAISNVVVRS